MLIVNDEQRLLALSVALVLIFDVE